MSGGAKTTTTNTQQQNPWAPAQPFMTQNMGDLQSWANQWAGKSYGGPTFAGMGDLSKAGFNQLAAGPQGGGSDYFRRAAAGDFLNKDNPYIQNLQGSVMGSVAPAVNAQFARAGMSGGTQHQGVMGRQVADAMAPALFQNYQHERGLQQAAAGQLSGMDRQAIMDRIMAGGAFDADRQGRMNADKQRWAEQKGAGLQDYGALAGLFGGYGKMGGATTSTGTQQQQNPWWQAPAGLGMMGLGALSSPFGGWMLGAPWGQRS